MQPEKSAGKFPRSLMDHFSLLIAYNLYPLRYIITVIMRNYTRKGAIALKIKINIPFVVYLLIGNYVHNRKGINIKLSSFLKQKRSAFGLTHPELAQKAGVGLRFVRDLWRVLQA